MKEVITANDPRIQRLNILADDITNKCQKLREEYHPLLGGKRFMTDAMLLPHFLVSAGAQRKTTGIRDTSHITGSTERYYMPKKI